MRLRNEMVDEQMSHGQANECIGDEFFKTIRITPLDDPKMFLEVDEDTLVVLVSPGVP